MLHFLACNMVIFPESKSKVCDFILQVRSQNMEHIIYRI